MNRGNNPLRVLVVCYSLSGHTRGLADEIAVALDADRYDIREPGHPRGLRRMLRALLERASGRIPEIESPLRVAANCSAVVLGGPIWAGRLAGPVRRFARDYTHEAPILAFFCTMNGSNPRYAFDDLAELSDRIPAATMAVDAGHMIPARHHDALRAFVDTLRLHVQ